MLSFRPDAAIALLLLATAAITPARTSSEPAEECQEYIYCPRELTGSLPLTGSASMDVTPDVGLVALTIVAKAPLATTAREQAAAAATAVFDAIEDVEGMSPDDIATQGVQLTLQYKYVTDDDGNSVMVYDGYMFTQQLLVTVKNLTEERLAGVVDAAVLAGANNVTVDSIQMTLSPDLQLASVNAVRAAAVKNGLDTAKLLTQSANMTLVALTYMSDSNVAPVTISRPAAGEGAAAPAPAPTPTPVSIGDTTVSASLSMTFTTCFPAPAPARR